MKMSFKVFGAAAGLATVAPFALAVADTDDLFPTFDLSTVMANAASVITQTLPIWGLVAGIILAVAGVNFVLHLVRRTPYAGGKSK